MWRLDGSMSEWGWGTVREALSAAAGARRGRRGGGQGAGMGRGGTWGRGGAGAWGGGGVGRVEGRDGTRQLLGSESEMPGASGFWMLNKTNGGNRMKENSLRLILLEKCY